MGVKQGPVILIVLCIGAVFYMSRNAENREAKRQTNAQRGSPHAVIPPDGNSQSGQNANESHQYPSWIDTFRWPEGATAWALFLTLVVIGWQSNETRRAANAALTQEQNVRKKERARLEVVFPPDPPTSLEQTIVNRDDSRTELVEISVEIMRDGESNAYNVRVVAQVSARGTLRGEKFLSWGDELQCPKVIRDADSDKPVRISLAPGGFGSFITIPQKEMESVRQGKAFLHAFGRVSYEDVFEGGHTTPFHFVWYVQPERGWEEGWDDITEEKST
ncbi:MAG: hypothetical protein WA399_14185 [Acidobacteriaceae bacterium]